MIRAILAVPLIVFAGCGTRAVEESAADVVSYDLVDFHVESREGCDSIGASCTFYHIRYPQFYNVPDAVADSLQKALDQTLSMGDSETSDHSLRDAGQKFVNDYKDFTREFEEPVMGWYFTADVVVNILSDTLISLVTETQFYTGGAHGGRGTFFTNIDPGSGSRVTLGMIYSPETLRRIERLAEVIFRQSYGIGPAESLAEAGYTFAGDKFTLNDNYGFSGEGLVFVYNIYEVAPYSMGHQEIVVPYEQIGE